MSTERYEDNLLYQLRKGILDMTAQWIQGTLCIAPENPTERDALLMLWRLRKDYRFPIDSEDFGVRADGVTDDTAALQALLNVPSVEL